MYFAQSLPRVLRYVYDDVTYVYDDVRYVYDDVTYVYDDVTYVYDGGPSGMYSHVCMMM